MAKTEELAIEKQSTSACIRFFPVRFMEHLKSKTHTPTNKNYWEYIRILEAGTLFGEKTNPIQKYSIIYSS